MTENESRIVWLEDPMKFTYLRESCYCTTKPAAMRIKGRNDRLIGYTIHKADGSRVYCRRFWHLEKHDRDLDPSGVYADNCPFEAVLPSSVRLGVPSMRFWPVMMRAKGQDVPDMLWNR